MTELAMSSSNDESRLERFFNSNDSLAAVSEDLDRAISRGEFGVARALSPLQVEIEERRGVSMALARSYLKNSALPTAEALSALQHGHEIDDTLSVELDHTYEDIAEHINVLLRERRSLPVRESDYYKKVRKELTGGISELATFAIPSRLGRYANLLLIPSSDSEDIAGYDEHGNNIGIDFRGYLLGEAYDLHNPIGIQLKTGRRALKSYDPSILTIALNDLTPHPSQAYEQLPRAIVNDARGESTQEENAIISQTSRNLLHRVAQHYSALNNIDTPEE